MGTSGTEQTLSQALDDMVMRARADEIPALVAERARRATVKVLREDPHARAGMALRRRAEAYFTACVRRATVRGRAGARATARLVAAAVVADLLDAGRDRAAVWSELQHGWSERLPDDVLEEYRMQLCG